MPNVNGLELPDDYLLARASYDELEIVDAVYPEFGISASVQSGRLGFKIVTENPVARTRAGIRGSILFDAMIRWFDNRFQAIISRWVEGTNLEKLNELTTRGMPVLDAAPFTWTGRQCIRHGFARMSLEEALGGLAGHWGKVVIRWEREDT